jgi:hypothetical protein
MTKYGVKRQRIQLEHRRLTRLGIPIAKDGNRLGLGARKKIAEERRGSDVGLAQSKANLFQLVAEVAATEGE